MLSQLLMLNCPSAQRFALPALGRAAGRRPTGKMLRRRKRLGIAPESPASGARFVGQLLSLAFESVDDSNSLLALGS
jgi:hypothetical protein